LLGIILLASGLALLAADVLIPGFLYGAALGGIWALLAPFGLILGALLIFASLVEKRNKNLREANSR
jgi:hypothetical protein